MQKKYLKKFLEQQPSFQALFRSYEAEAIIDYTFREPILDLGCGDGLFASIFFRRNTEIIGLDINANELVQARRRRIYKQLINSNAASIPLSRNTIGTIIANSSFEHMDDLTKVLNESYRVLKNGGSLIITGPGDKRVELYGCYQLFSALGLKRIGLRLGRLENNFFKHINCWSEKKWEANLKKIGFKKIEYKHIASKKIAFIADLLVPLAFVGIVEKKFFGRYLSWRKYIAPIFYMLLSKIRDNTPFDNGAILVIKAVK